jgi:hypothetical protein
MIAALALWMGLDFAQRPMEEAGLTPDAADVGRRLLARARAPASTSVEARAPEIAASMPKVGHGPAAQAVAPPSTASAPPARLRPGEVDICGLGIRQGEALEIPAAPAELRASMPPLAIAPDAVVTAGLPELWRLLGRTLRASPDVHHQAAALAMDLPAAGEVVGAGSSDMSGPLRDLALRTNDPMILQWSFERCSFRRDPSCVHVSARQWVRAEPGNLASWLALLVEEPSAHAEAAHGMALARFSDLRQGQLASLLEIAIPEDTPPYLRMTALMQALGRGSSLLANSAALMKLCDPSSLGDSNRRQQCDAIAHVLVENGRDRLSFMQGAVLADRLGWPDSRRASLTEKSQSVRMQGGALERVEPAQPYSCASIAAMRQMLQRDVGEGELAGGAKATGSNALR